jgi:hypothetical protein
MTRRTHVSKFGAFLLLFSSILFAQQELLGTYRGTFDVEGSRNRNTHGLELQITSIESGTMTGKLKVMGGNCRGDYSISGKYSSNEFALRTAAGEIKGCGNTRLVLAVRDGKLVGQYGRSATELSK